MNNFRHPGPKSFGNRNPDPWMTEAELASMRRPSSHFPSVMHSGNPNMHSSLLGQPGLLSTPKPFMNPNACNMPSSNFSNAHNPDIFKLPHSMNELNYSNRFVEDRFPNNSFPHANLHHKMNEPLIKDLPTPNMMSPRPHKNDGFSGVLKQPLLPNVRMPQQRFSCMQNDQAMFHTKYDNSPVFQGKEFPFSNNKESRLPNSLSYNDKSPQFGGNNLPSYKPNFRPTSLFPAYGPKDNSETSFQRSQNLQEESSKNVHHSAYSSDFVGKFNNFHDKTPHSPKTVEPFHEKTESYQEESDVFKPNNKSSFLDDNQSIKTMPISPVPQDSYNAMNPQMSHDSFKPIPNSQMSHDTFKPMQDPQVSHDTFKSIQDPQVSHNTLKSMQDPQASHDSFKSMQNPQVSHDTFKSMQNSQVSHDSFKALKNKASSPNSKYPFASESQQACFQSSNEIPFQRPQNMAISNHPTTSASHDCLMQNTQFSSQSHVLPSTKDTFSSFNFESNINSTDIADLLPGLDAFLKETLNKSEELLSKPEEDASKSEFSKSSVPSCAFSDDEWSKHSIPFIGENQASGNDNQNDIIKESHGDQAAGKETYKFELTSQKTAELTDIDQSNNNNLANQSQQKSSPFQNKEVKVLSALEEAIDLLLTTEPIVGLEYIIEYKKTISQPGSFPFRCNLCNSGITRPSIIDHIIGSKHRMRYLKIKNEPTYESLVSLKVEKSEKDAKIAEASFAMQTIYGRGNVIVNTVDSPKGIGVNNVWKEASERTEEPVFTLDKISIGFEALSPHLDELDTSDFYLESDLNRGKQDASNNASRTEKVTTPPSTIQSEVKREVPNFSNSNDSVLKLTGLNTESPSCSIKSEVLESSLKSDVLKTPDEESSLKDSQHDTESSQIKRPLSPESICQTKKIKTETIDDLGPSSDVKLAEDLQDIKFRDSLPERKEFSLDIFDQLSKSEISTDEEASIVLKVVGMLMQMFLRYKLHHIPLEKMENLMQSLQIGNSTESLEELKSLLKDNKILKETQDKEPSKANTVHQSNQTKAEQNLPSCLEKNNSKDHELMNISSHFDTIDSQPVTKIDQVTNIDQNSMSSGLKTVSKVEAATSAATFSGSRAAVPENFQVGGSIGLTPPPFFSWPQTSDALTNVSYATGQGNQNMMWSTAYQHSQSQYNQLPYYHQPQNYVNTFSGNQPYQAQFSVMPPSSVPLGQPPLPPPPPPPPPADPPLPPLKQLLPTTANLPMFLKNPPPPPPPLP